jgi:hypothetical protein
VDFSGLKKIRFERARDAAAGLELSPQARRLLAADPDTVAFLAECASAGLWVDALRVMAMALPRREAAWWACLNARDARTEDSPQETLAPLEAAEAWVFKPSDELGQQAFAQAQTAGFDSAEAYAALAVHWAGGNMAPPEAGVVVPPGDGLTATATAAAVLLAAASGDPAKAEAWYERALMQALDIARGGSGRLQS